MQAEQKEEYRFARLLFLSQLDPDGLSTEEFEKLEAHLNQEPPREHCCSQIVRNGKILEAICEVLDSHDETN